MERKQKNDFVPIRTRKNPAAYETHPYQKPFLDLWKLPARTCELDPHEGDTSDIAIVQPTEHPRTSPPGSTWSEHMPLYLSCVLLPEFSVSQAMGTGGFDA